MQNEKHSCSNFDDVMDAVGKVGPFQKRFIYYAVGIIIFASMSYFNLVLALAIPEHWCYVPGREFTNYTIDEWKKITIPIETGPKGTLTYSKCKMFNITGDLLPPHNWIKNDTRGLSIIDCQYGWNYDKKWYKETVPSEENWVCEKQMYAANLLASFKLAEVIGAFVIGQLTDIIGRRYVIFISLLLLIVGRTMSAFTSSNVLLFTLAASWGSLSLCPIVHTPIVLTAEISRKQDAARISMNAYIAWTIGFALIPFIQWALGYWSSFMLVTTLPSVLLFLPYRYMAESPRWLASRKQYSKCLKELNKIAKANGTKVPDDAPLAIRSSSNVDERRYGLISLFSSWRLAKNTVCISVCWAVVALTNFTLILNVGNMGGNPFLNYAFQALVEIPGYVMAKYSTNYFGRRATYLGASIAAFATYILFIFLSTKENINWLLTCMVVLLKFTICLTTQAITLQALETYPTCIRQSGIALASIAANLVGVFGPYITLMGSSIDVRYPYIINAAISLVAIICAIMLPETLHEKAPETLADAREFGQNQEYTKVFFRKKKGNAESEVLNDE